jgi:hypothetical protein
VMWIEDQILIAVRGGKKTIKSSEDFGNTSHMKAVLRFTIHTDFFHWVHNL